MKFPELKALSEKHLLPLVTEKGGSFDNIPKCIGFKYVVDDVSFGVGTTFSDYNTSFGCLGFGASITFPKVAEILTPLLVKHQLLSSNHLKLLPTTIDSRFYKHVSKAIYPHNPNLRNNQEIIVSNETEAQVFLDHFINFYKQEALVFFEEFGTLQNFAQFLAGVSFDDMLIQFEDDYDAFLLKAVVLRLTNHPQYAAYMDEVIASNKADYEDDPSEEINRWYYEASLELKGILGNT